MAPWLIIAVGVVYLAIAADLMMSGKEELALVFAAYSVSNLGLYLAAR